MGKIAIIPATHRWRLFLEHEAIRIFGGLAGSSRNKVRQRILADAMLITKDRTIAEADADSAIAFIDQRIEYYTAARAIEIVGGSYRERVM